MKRISKGSQLQIRVSGSEKMAIRNAARRAGMDMSAYVLRRVLRPSTERFQDLLASLNDPVGPSYGLAELNSLLAGLTMEQLRDAVEMAPRIELAPFLGNYVAAMVESACVKRHLPVPVWAREMAPLENPQFGSGLESVRLYLLIHSPAAFRRRNIFVDTDIGSRV